MKIFRALSFVCAMAALAPFGAGAQTWPTKPIHIIVPYAAGGTDVQVRALAPLLAKQLGQPVIVENRDGGGATIGTMAVKSAPADGYTLLFSGTAPVAVQPHVQKLEYSKDDFVALGNLTATPLVLAVRGDAPYKTFKELLAYAKANPYKVNMGTVGTGSTLHLAGLEVMMETGTRFTHVPFRGSAPAVQGILSGYTDLLFGVPSGFKQLEETGKLRVIATLDRTRTDFFPNVPTTVESGVNLIEVTKFGMFAPAGVPMPVREKLAAAIKTAVATPEFHEAMAKLQTKAVYMSPAELQADVDAESARWAAFFKDPTFLELLKK